MPTANTETSVTVSLYAVPNRTKFFTCSQLNAMGSYCLCICATCRARSYLRKFLRARSSDTDALAVGELLQGHDPRRAARHDVEHSVGVLGDAVVDYETALP